MHARMQGSMEGTEVVAGALALDCALTAARAVMTMKSLENIL